MRKIIFLTVLTVLCFCFAWMGANLASTGNTEQELQCTLQQQALCAQNQPNVQAENCIAQNCALDNITGYPHLEAQAIQNQFALNDQNSANIDYQAQSEEMTVALTTDAETIQVNKQLRTAQCIAAICC